MFFKYSVFGVLLPFTSVCLFNHLYLKQAPQRINIKISYDEDDELDENTIIRILDA